MAGRARRSAVGPLDHTFTAPIEQSDAIGKGVGEIVVIHLTERFG